MFNEGTVIEGPFWPEPACRYFKAEVSPELIEGEVLIRADLCKPEEEEYASKKEEK